ncbi:MAG: AAA family ATPase [Solobacterium sp.]|nr:AAA family ATPase [Solobacterium sp.]
MKEDLSGREEQYIAITRPRRFGKTFMAGMLASFFSKAISDDVREVFSLMHIGFDKNNLKEMGKHNVVFINFSKEPDNCDSYSSYINRIIRIFKNDLRIQYPEIDYPDEYALGDILDIIYNQTEESFIFVFDEWDHIFHHSYVTESDKTKYLKFLENLLKDKAYVEMAYITGIVPISKMGGPSLLNMFYEYNLGNDSRFDQYFGSKEEQVDDLYKRYLRVTKNPLITRIDLRVWYDGYVTRNKLKLYNPKSVITALTNNMVSSYWSDSGSNTEIYDFIKYNLNDVRNDIGKLILGESVFVQINDYASNAMALRTRKQIFPAMVVYGLLTYEDGRVKIPNNELNGMFADLLENDDMDYLHELHRESYKMYTAMREGDTESIAKIIEGIHLTESPVLQFNNEAELTNVMTLATLSMRNAYYVTREDKAGKGYADFLFYPINPLDNCYIVELKSNDTAENALQQVLSRQYELAFKPKIGESQRFQGKINAYGVAWQENKDHSCKMKIIRDASYSY